MKDFNGSDMVGFVLREDGSDVVWNGCCVMDWGWGGESLEISWENGSLNQMRGDDGWAVLVEIGMETNGWICEILR